jgi:hypothetical protein
MFQSLSDHPQGARSFLFKVTEFKITKNIKDPLWQCHNGPFIFLVILNSETLTRKL